MNISELCIRRPVFTTLVTASIIAFGAFAYRLLPVAALPAVDFPTISVSAQLPGASPETMAASVASPIERQLSTIAGISSMTSSSSLGNTQITIQFDLNRNIDDVRTVVSKANSSAPVGALAGPNQNITLVATSAMEHADAYRDVVVAYRNGQPIKLTEIARIIDGVENDKIATWFNDTRAIVMA